MDSILDVESLEYHATMYGMNMWYKYLFEKLGWMILAEHDNYSHKIIEYKRGIEHFLKAVSEKISYVNEKDRKVDLQILKRNTEILQNKVNQIFPNITVPLDQNTKLPNVGGTLRKKNVVKTNKTNRK
jgi:regulation of enolase protein 1 (concanavalin A-like superfamily)